jgi:type I restriction enzyme S subunit
VGSPQRQVRPNNRYFEGKDVMANHWATARFGGFLTQRKESFTIDDFAKYKRARVQLHGKGIILRDEVQGSEIKTKKQQAACKGELLVAEIDAKVGGFGIVPPELDGGIVSSHYFLFEIDEGKCLHAWLDWFVRSGMLEEQVTAQGSTNYAAIRPSHVLEYEIPLPPLTEQQRIVARIEELARRVEEARGLRREAVEEADSLKASTLDAVFQESLAKYPTKEIQEACDVVRGGSPRPAGNPLYYGGDIPFIKVGDITKDEGKFLYEAESTVNELGMQHSRFIPVQTLMLTNSGATLGVPKITMIAGCFNDGSQAFLNLTPEVFDEYLYYFFKSKTRWFRESPARGQGQPNLNTDMVKPLKFPCPSLNVQKEMVAYLDNLQAKMDDLRRLQAETQKELDALMPSVLAKAFAGEL